MNTLLKITAILTAIATPAAFTLEAHGVSLPTPLHSSYLFGAFVTALTVLTMIVDYTGATLVHAGNASSATSTVSRSTLPLAA